MPTINSNFQLLTHVLIFLISKFNPINNLYPSQDYSSLRRKGDLSIGIKKKNYSDSNKFQTYL